MIQLNTAAHVASSAPCERCMAHERFITDVKAIWDGDPTPIDRFATLFFAALHAPASDRTWRDIVRDVATIFADAHVRARRGPHYGRLRQFLAENADLL